MHLSEFMAANDLSDEQVGLGIGKTRASVSRYRRRLVRPEFPDVIERIKAYTNGQVTADDWTGPLVTEASAEPEPAQTSTAA